MSKARRYFAGLSLFCVLSVSRPFSNGNHSEEEDIVKTITIKHPGLTEAESVSKKLMKRQANGNRFPEYFVNANSVYCTDDICEVVRVKIVWDELGYYKGFELEPGVTLEKAEGKRFTEEDYTKLHEILGDRDSMLKEVETDDIKTEANSNDPHDAVTGATPVIFEDSAVKGAAWTSFTLWHWANNEISDVILDMTSRSATINDLRTYLKNGDDNQRRFAFEKLIELEAYDRETLEVLVDGFLGNEREQTKLAVDYLEGFGSGDYSSAVNRLLAVGDAEHRAIILNSLLKTERSLGSDFLDGVGMHLAGSKSYQDIDLMFQLFEERKHLSPRILEVATSLLGEDDFIIARRAFWFLADQELSPSYRKAVDAFGEKHADYL